MSYSESVSRSGYVLKLESGEVVVLHRVTSNYALSMVVRNAKVVGLPEGLASGLYRAKVVLRVSERGEKSYAVEVSPKKLDLSKEVARLDALVADKPNRYLSKKPGVTGYMQKEALVNAAAVEAKDVTRRLADSLRALA